MRLGPFSLRVDIERPVYDSNLTGESTPSSWEPVATNVPAKRESKSAREFVADGLVPASQIAAFFTIRWRPDVDATMRLKLRTFGSTPREFEFYNIAGVLQDDLGGRRWLVMPCTLGVNEG